MECNELSNFWIRTGLTFQLAMSEATGSYISWLEEKLARCTQKQFEYFALAAHKVWNRQNKLRLKEQEVALTHLWQEVDEEWKVIHEDGLERVHVLDTAEMVNREGTHHNNDTDVIIPNRRTTNSVCWRASVWNFIKINVDASLRANGEGSYASVDPSDAVFRIPFLMLLQFLSYFIGVPFAPFVRFQSMFFLGFFAQDLRLFGGRGLFRGLFGYGDCAIGLYELVL
ncbi:uncharacterized protein G2W53_039164 [Senna tora]|uniref:Uncharacterized protein n=1 Tax=Senna tora TaxID=362788 RepID=A0A834W375_9FABA|nr:uncharacterized protein G2W53_039164 [Senna tora]